MDIMEIGDFHMDIMDIQAMPMPRQQARQPQCPRAQHRSTKLQPRDLAKYPRPMCLRLGPLQHMMLEVTLEASLPVVVLVMLPLWMVVVRMPLWMVLVQIQTVSWS